MDEECDGEQGDEDAGCGDRGSVLVDGGLDGAEREGAVCVGAEGDEVGGEVGGAGHGWGRREEEEKGWRGEEEEWWWLRRVCEREREREREGEVGGWRSEFGMV